MKMKGQSNIDNTEKLATRRRKLATQGTQDEDKTQGTQDEDKTQGTQDEDKT